MTTLRAHTAVAKQPARGVDGELRQPSDALAEVAPRRLLGAFYTPERLARVLVRWSLRGAPGRIMDPSFGGCAFLVSALNELKRLKAPDAGKLVFGVDVDPGCTAHVASVDQLLPSQCVVQDFLAVRPENMPGAPFDAIVGNPPYVRHHWLKGDRKYAAHSAVSASDVDIPATASTWAYFLVHSLAFLKQGARLAMLVPEAILQADYAVPVRKALADRFESVLLVHIRERLFQGTDEPVVAVLASGFGGTGSVHVESIERTEDLAPLLEKKKDGRQASRGTTNGRSLKVDAKAILKSAEEHQCVSHFGDLGTVRIGFVTGANSHFIRNRQELERLGVPDQARLPVVSRTRWLSSLEFDSEDHAQLAAEGRAAFLVVPPTELDTHSGVRSWIREGEKQGIHRRYKCTLREDWYRMVLPTAPDAFASCTRLGSPLLVLNAGSYHCSNALHAVWWKDSVRFDPRSVAVGFLTSLVALWAELNGRRYGGGVLKIEPGTLKRIPIPVVLASSGHFQELSDLVRQGNESQARSRADEIVLGEGLGMSHKDIAVLQSAQQKLAAQRRPTSRGGQNG